MDRAVAADKRTSAHARRPSAETATAGLLSPAGRNTAFTPRASETEATIRGRSFTLPSELLAAGRYPPSAWNCSSPASVSNIRLSNGARHSPKVLTPKNFRAAGLSERTFST